MITRFIKTFALLAMLLIFLGALFIFHAIKEIPEGVLLKMTEQAQKISRRELSFEEGALLNKKDFEFFYPFTSQKLSFEKWKLENEYLGLDRSYPKKFVILQDFKIKGLRLNSCHNLYCLGIKLRFEEIPSIFWKGLIGIEDARFLEHFGIDFFSILRAIITDIKKLKLVQGGSTITQQLVKNLFYSNKKSFYRKLKEMVVAIYLELRYQKEDILEIYFNEVYWGSLQGIRIKGIHVASLVYFGKSPSEISPFEAALLISMLKGPEYYHPLRHPERLKKRAEIVYQKLISLHLFPREKKNIWSEKEWAWWHKKLVQLDDSQLLRGLWRASVRTSEVLDDYRSFKYISESLELVQRLQRRDKKRDGDFSVRIMIKNLNDSTDENFKNIFSYYSKFERDELKALKEEKAQVGSTLKPLLYSLFFDKGLDESDLVSVKPLTLNLLSGPWSPREAHKVQRDKIDLKTALQHSYNRPIIYLAQKIGFENLEKELLIYLPQLKLPLREYPAQLLGAIELSLFELLQVYSQLLTQKCQDFLETENPHNNIIYLLSDPTQTTIRKLVSKEMKNMQFFGKTGTSNFGRDNWFVFFDGKKLGIILVSVEGKNDGKEWGLYGGTTAFKIFQEVMISQGLRINELECNL